MNSTEETTETELDGLLGKLKKLRPVPKRVKVLCTDGETRDLPIHPSRQRWAKLRRTIGALDWMRVEAFDSRSQLLDAFETEADVDFAGSDDDSGQTAMILSIVARLVKLNMQSQKDALEQQAKQSKALLEGAAKCVSVMTESMGAVHRLYETRLSILDAMVGDREEDGQEGGLLSTKFLDAISGEVAKAAGPHIIEAIAGAKKNGS